MSNKTSGSSGVSGLTLLGIVFVTLKLCGVIDWSWWWVSAPIWIPLTVAVVLLGAAALLKAG